MAQKLGNELKEKYTDEICFDEKNLVFSTSAYMKETARPHEVFEGIERMVREISKKLDK